MNKPMDHLQLPQAGSSTDRHQGQQSEDDLSYSSRFTSAGIDTSCKKHPGKPSCYFISEEPWIQFCSKCALNMALCGKKIQRRLSEDERRRKLEIQGIVFELKSKSKIAEEREAEIKSKIAIIEGQHLVEVQNLLRFYDTEIEEWTRKRNEVYKAYSEEILDYFKILQEVRYRFSLSAMELKNTLQTIQNNFVAIIHDIPASDFQEEIGQYRRNLDKVVENQEKVYQFDKKKDVFDKLVKELISKTEAFKTAKKIPVTPHASVSASYISQGSKTRLIDPTDSRKQEQSLTPSKRQTGIVLQEQNFFSKDDQVKLRLKPAVSQVVSSTSKSKLPTERSKRTNSRLVPPEKQQLNITARVSRI